MGGLRFVLRVIDAVNEWAGRISSILVICITGVMVFEVISRYGFNSPTEWSFELSGFLFLAYILLGGGYTLLHKSHVNTDIFYSRLSLKGRAILDVVTAVLFFLFAVSLTWEGWRYAVSATIQGQHSATPWHPPIFVAVWLLPVGGGLLLIQGIAKFIRDLAIVATGKEEEADEH